jgi:hypothetical protein
MAFLSEHYEKTSYCIKALKLDHSNYKLFQATLSTRELVILVMTNVTKATSALRAQHFSFLIKKKAISFETPEEKRKLDRSKRK